MKTPETATQALERIRAYRKATLEAFAFHLLDQTFGDTMAERKTTDKKSGAALGDAQKTQPKEFDLPKAGAKATEEPKNAYVDSPPSFSGFTVQSHDRDSVQPGPEPEGVYAPEAARKGKK